MIRSATTDDIPALIEIGKKFALKAGLANHVGFDPDSLAATLMHLITSDDGICLITADQCGAAGGLLYPHPFNLKVRVGQELFWWAGGSDGGALFDALEAAAKAQGAQYWTMTTLEAISPKAIGRIYERRGYRALEHTYIKEIAA